MKIKAIERLCKVRGNIVLCDEPVVDVEMPARQWMGDGVALYPLDGVPKSEGEWRKRGNEKTCSLCKFIYYSNNDEWNFCPNCGARMRGADNEQRKAD